jgi:GH25 family lysozyme M1 (1,4-beta-N-acetylmuramidase)
MVVYLGTDLSHHNYATRSDGSFIQSSIDFQQLKKAASFVIAKCTEGSEAGSHFYDNTFAYTITQANKVGLMTHAYHYFRGISENDARAEARWTEKNLRKAKVKGQIFCDVEDNSLIHNKSKLTKYVAAYFDELYRLGYKKLGLYVNLNFYRNFIDYQALKKEFPGLLLWLARYNFEAGYKVDVWQFTSTKKIRGVDDPTVDLDYAYTNEMVDVKAAKDTSKKSAVSKIVDKVKKTVTSRKTHKIKSGDTLWEIAQSLKGVSVSDLIRWNPGVNPQALRIGSKIYIEGPKATNKKKTAKISLPGGILKRGSRGKDVLTLQKALVKANFYPNKHVKNNGCDGIFGPDTEDAVRRFQSVYCNPADGIYGPKTRAALLKKLS